MASVLVPVAYIIVVFGSLLVFSYFYRKRLASRIPDPYFPPHIERNTYMTLLQQTDPPASDALLKAALVRRAIADVHRVLRIREDKPALQSLLQKGAIGDDLYNSLLAAEKELEAEIVDVVTEANSFVENWGQLIFPTANEIIANEKMRALFEKTGELKADLETRYDVKAVNTGSAQVDIQITMGPPPGASTPATPMTPSTANTTNGLAPQSALLSPGPSPNWQTEDESDASPVQAKTKTAKKGKKRK